MDQERSRTNRIDRKRSGSNRICSKYIEERKLHIRNIGLFTSEQDESGVNLIVDQAMIDKERTQDRPGTNKIDQE